MTTPHTSIRLIKVTDAEAIANHLARDQKELARWEPARPEGFHTTAHQVGRIETLWTPMPRAVAGPASSWPTRSSSDR